MQNKVGFCENLRKYLPEKYSFNDIAMKYQIVWTLILFNSVNSFDIDIDIDRKLKVGRIST